MKKFTDFAPSITGKFSFSQFLLERNESGNKEPNLKDRRLEDFFQTLERAIDDKMEFREETSNYTYSKEVENIQAALNFLGYELPRYGVDGKFGPETGAAVAKFKKDHPISVKLGRAITESNAETFMKGVKAAGGEVTDADEVNGGGDLTSALASLMPNVIKAIEDKGIDVTITAGNDDFHHGLNYTSRHTMGEAIDFVISPNSRETRIKVEKILRDFMATNPGLSYINEYDKPTAAATGGHFHVSYRPGQPETQGIGLVGSEYKANPIKVDGGDLVTYETGEVITTNFIKALVQMLNNRGFDEADLETYLRKKDGTILELDVKDFDNIAAKVIDKLEGGYYHPDMLKDGRLNDPRYSGSGETMMGIDRKNGGDINETPEGVEFWNIIDAAGARTNWEWNYRGGDLEERLRGLATKMIKNNYDEFAQRYLSDKALDIVNDDPKLLFNFVYAVWNGPGWFQRFAEVINTAVANGETDPEELFKTALYARLNNGNSLIAQTGRKIDALFGTNLA